MRFDTAAFLADNFPTPAHVISALDTFGCRLPTEHAVRKWFDRNQIPAAYLPLLLAIVEQSRGGLRVGQYMREGANDGA
jgi:hypothetical protein